MEKRYLEKIIELWILKNKEKDYSLDSIEIILEIIKDSKEDLIVKKTEKNTIFYDNIYQDRNFVEIHNIIVEENNKLSALTFYLKDWIELESWRVEDVDIEIREVYKLKEQNIVIFCD